MLSISNVSSRLHTYYIITQCLHTDVRILDMHTVLRVHAFSPTCRDGQQRQEDTRESRCRNDDDPGHGWLLRSEMMIAAVGSLEVRSLTGWEPASFGCVQPALKWVLGLTWFEPVVAFQGECIISVSRRLSKRRKVANVEKADADMRSSCFV